MASLDHARTDVEGSVAAGPPPPVRRLAAAWRRLDGRWSRLARPALIYLASRVLVLAAMVVSVPVSHRSFGQAVGGWDGKWFLRAASAGWPSRLPMVGGHVAKSTLAFFPVFPLLIRTTASLTGAPPLVAGAVLSLVTGLTAMLAVWCLVADIAAPGAADRATLLLAVFPAAFVFSMVYSEGVVLTLVALGLLTLLRRRWWRAGLLGLLATATSPVALAFVAACAWTAVSEIRRRGDWRALTAPVTAALGFVGVQLWLWAQTGNLSAWRTTEQHGWHSTVSAAYPWHVLTSFAADPVATTQTTDLLVAGTLVTALCVVVAVRERQPAPLLVYGVTVALGAFCTAPVGLRPRFLLLAFPLVLAVGIRLRGAAYAVTAAASAVLMVAMTLYTLCTYGAFP